MTDKQKKVLYRIIATALLYAVLLVMEHIVKPDSVFCNRLGHYVQSREKYITRTGI